MLAYIQTYFNQRFDKWLSNRLNKSQSQKLSNRNIYIFPSKFGFAYLLFVFLLFLLGTNYQNNLILLFSFLLASFFVSVMLHTFFNLSGLEVSAEDEYRLFKGKESAIKLNVQTRKPLYALEFVFGDNSAFTTDINSNSRFIEVDYSGKVRGLYDIQRLKISSRYAFDLFNCWSYIQFSSQIIVYPEPVEINQVEFDHILSLARQNQDETVDEHSNLAAKTRGEDFSELRRYQLGESISQIAWKNVAKGQPWMTKHYENNVSDKLILSLEHILADELEKKLGVMCYVLLNLHSGQLDYGLNLQNVNVLPDNSFEHFERCLRMLADYEP